MSDNSTSQSQLMANMVILYGALQEYLLKFSQSTTSYSDYTSFEWYDINGTEQSMNIPSIGHIKSDIESVKDQLESLISNNDDKITLRYKDGTIKSFEMQKISHLIDTLNGIQTTEFEVPIEFRAKNNWMFESFLNPLLVTSVNVGQFTKDNDIKKFSVRRIILNSPTTDNINYFNNNFKGRNDLSHDNVITSLQNSGIAYNLDDNEYELSSSINRFRGSFNVIKIDYDTANISNSEYSRIYYTLDKLFYTDIINNPKGNTYLVENDILITSDDTEYTVKSIDKSTRRVLLERSFGSSPIAMGVGILKIKPQAYRIPELQIGIGYNEREIIFVKPISTHLDLTTDTWSKGFGIFTNELNILLSDGQSIALDLYYNTYVADFGLAMLNMSKEKQIPAAIGLTPIAPILNPDDLKITNINSHITDDKSSKDFKSKIATKESLKNQINEINKSINAKKSVLNTSSTSNEQERLSVQKSINDLVTEKAGLQKQLSTILDEITYDIKSSNVIGTSTKYRVRGFTLIPQPRVGEYGNQYIIQMIVSYRYKSKSGGSNTSENIPLSESDGTITPAYFSNWTEVRSKLRMKKYDSDKGVYVWADEDVQNSDVTNINQIDIPISRGEIVEIRMKSVSEAGYPLNPLESAWSNVIEYEFPAELEVESEDSLLSERLVIEDALVGFQDELNARGLDNHLLDSIITGDKYYSHKLEGIASGFFTSEGNIINGYEFLKSLSNRIDSIEKSISISIGEIKVNIIDSEGVSYTVNQGSNLELFAGFYDELSENEGDIISKVYTVNIENISANILQLVSRFGGGIGESVPESINMTDDYGMNRKYDFVPLSISTNDIPDNTGEFKQIIGFQSEQVKSQFIYNRYKDYSLSKMLYSSSVISDDSYNYNSRLQPNGNIPTPSPTDGIKYLPNIPTSQANTTTGIWNGYITNNNIGANGETTEFCIASDHPGLIELANTGNYNGINTINELVKKINEPELTINGQQKYLTFSHSVGFDTSVEETTNVIGMKYYQQCKYYQPEVYTTPILNNTLKYYPNKIGFAENDNYLIGRYTCGAYLFTQPNSYDNISIKGNHPELANIKLNYGSENSINIPVIFQFRCTDKKGYIGGYRYGTETPKNITYKKTIGFDIYEKLSSNIANIFDDVFSFDLTISCKYKKDVTDTTINVTSTTGVKNVSYNL